MRRLTFATAASGVLLCVASPAASASASAGVDEVSVPEEARLASVRHPTTVIGNGTPSSCTSARVVKAVRKGGVITFNCGSGPVVIKMRATAKVINTRQKVVIDGGGKVTLDGQKEAAYPLHAHL